MGDGGGLGLIFEKSEIFGLLQVGRIDVEAFSVIFTESELLDGGAVFTGAIAFIAVPAIVGEFFVQLAHIIIPHGLGQDAGGGDGCIGGVTLDDAAVSGASVFYESIAVDEEELGA